MSPAAPPTPDTSPPRVVRVSAPSLAAAALAEEVAALVASGSAVLALASGRSPLATYDRLAEQVAAGRATFRGATTFNLDEYSGLPTGAPGTFRADMEAALFSRVDLPAGRTHLPPSDVLPGPDAAAAAAAYEQAIADAGGLDLAILGLGGNGHVGFNEPPIDGATADGPCRCVALTQATRRANAFAFGGDPARVPTHAITMGLGTLRRARRLRMLVFGASKADALAQMLAAPSSPGCPASHLVGHPDLVIWADDAALSRVPSFKGGPN